MVPGCGTFQHGALSELGASAETHGFAEVKGMITMLEVDRRRDASETDRLHVVTEAVRPWRAVAREGASMASKRPRSVSPRVVRSLQSFAPELADLARYELSKRGMCSSVVLGNLDDDDFVLLRRCLPDPMWSVLPHVVLEARIACKQQVRGIRQSGYTPPVESIAAASSRSVVAVLDPRSRPLPKVAKLKPSVAPIPAVPDSEVARKKKAIRFLFDKFCKAGEAGDKWGHVYSLSAQDRDLHFALWEEQLMTTGISTLVAAQSTLRALCKDAESAGISPFNLPVHWIANWLKGHREERADGAT